MQTRLLEHALGERSAARRFETQLMSFFAMLALLLAAVGIYGLMHYSVAQQTRELGIRLALGARESDVLSHVLRAGLRLAVAGIIIGLAAALALTRVMRSLLYDVSPTDPLTLAAAAAVLVSVAFAACLLPAARAARLDPTTAMRHA